MAPKSTKAKKVADTKVAENDAPKKGRGKAKNIEEQETEVPELEVSEKVASIGEKKFTKRGKKVETNGQDTNSVTGDDVAPAKKGKKNLDENNDDNAVNGDNTAEEESSPVEEIKKNGDALENNGDSAEPQAAAKGRKKAQKKVVETKPKETGRGKKNNKQEENAADPVNKEEVEEKPKLTSKGRGRKGAKTEQEPEIVEKTESIDEDAKPAELAAAKGKKKGPAKAATEKSDNDKEETEEKAKAAKEKSDNEKEETEENNEDVEKEVQKESKKKESKGRKNQAKKAQNTEEIKEEGDKDEPISKKKKATKKDNKAKGDTQDDEVVEEAAEEIPVKGKRGQKKLVETLAETEEEPQDTGEQPTKRRRKQAEEKAPPADKKKAPLKNKAATNYEDLDFSNLSKTAQSKDWNYKIASWNVDGIRAWLSKGGLEYLKNESPDILCLQEVKCAQDKIPEELLNVPGYHAYWLCSDQDGYAGVGIYTSKLAMNVQYGLQNEELDSEGRIITAEYEHFYLISTYVPNAGRKLVTLPKRLQWNEEFRKYVKDLDKKKPVIICGDMNVAHNEIDLANPKTNKRNAGFTEEERAGMTELLGDGFVDTFRHLYPDKKGAYTFWTYMMNSRAKNVGWRLDYFIVSERLLPSLCDSVIRDGVYGSDHCPISLFLHLNGAEKPK